MSKQHRPPSNTAIELLAALVANPATRIAAVAKTIGFSRVKAQERMRYLVNSGYVTNEGKRYAPNYVVTDAGHAALKSIAKVAKKCPACGRKR